jgi:hypothetical protein
MIQDFLHQAHFLYVKYFCNVRKLRRNLPRGLLLGGDPQQRPARRCRGAGFRGRGVRVSVLLLPSLALPLACFSCLVAVQSRGWLMRCSAKVIFYEHLPSAWFDNTNRRNVAARCSFEQTGLNKETSAQGSPCTPFSVGYPHNME